MMGQVDKCIMCGKELVPWERIRSECIECREKTTETYTENYAEEGETAREGKTAR